MSFTMEDYADEIFQMKEEKLMNNDRILLHLNRKMFSLCNNYDTREIWKNIFTLENNTLLVELEEKDYPTNLNNMIRWISKRIEKRLEVGKSSYLAEVPITKEECEEHSRDNLEEAIDELLDLLVYLTATILSDKEIVIRDLLKRELNSLLFSAFTLAVSYKVQQQRLTIGETTNE
tara:strand:+ start:109 stop:636 length:528 start_codon:yes stop_codon:yes gene_type:complete